MTFTDPTIFRYLLISRVNVTTPDGLWKDVVPTGYYKDLKRTKQYSRFSILTYWPEKMANVAAYAKVSRDSKCFEHDCIECDADTCFDCRSGLFAQGKECVSSCNLGYYKEKEQCKACSEHCKECHNAEVCELCTTPWVVYSRKCHATCPRNYVVKDGVCIVDFTLEAGIRRNFNK